MLRQRIEQLQHEYTDQQVVVEGERPELARFRGLSGRVKTINMSGRALVQFEGGGAGWYDISLDYLKVVDPPEPKPAAAAAGAAAGAAAAGEPAAQPAKQPRPSPLELARLEKKEPAPAAAAPAAAEPVATAKKPPRSQPARPPEDPQRLSALELARMEQQPRQSPAPPGPGQPDET